MILDVLKLLVVFAVIVGVMWAKKPLLIAVTIASVVTILIYRLPFATATAAIFKGATAWSTIEALLVFYTLTYLQKMMEDRKDLKNAQVALNGLFNNRRINVSIAPFVLGMLPAASTVLICGPIVRDSVGDELSTEEKACITTYYRHISESFLPTYTSIFIAIALSEGRVTAASFVTAMVPMIILLFITGWLVYLHRVPKDTGMVPDQTKGYYWKLLARSVWPIALTIFLILAFNLPVEVAVAVCIVINIFVSHFKVRELIPFVKSAFETRLLLSTWMVMIFKEVLSATGVITMLPKFFSTFPIPTFMVYVLIFLFGTIVAGTQAIIVLCMPMAMASVGAGHTGLALFVLLMCVTYVSMQVSPTHICLTMCAEDYHVPLGGLIRKTIPLIAVFMVGALIYYGLLSMMGF